MNTLKAKYIIGKRKQNGSALLTVIVAMVIIGVLGVAIYTLTYTSLSNQAVAQRAPRAFYLSESGVRIAASEHKAALAVNTLNAKLPALQAKEFNMPDNGGKFQLEVYPYWFYATAADAASSSSTTIHLHLPGLLPREADDTDTAITFPASGLLKVRDSHRTPQWTGITYADYTGGVTTGTFDAATGGTPVTFNLSGTVFTDTIVTGDEFYIGYYNQYDSTLSGNDLILSVADINTAKLFPPSKGTIFIVKTDIKYYEYDLRIISGTSSPYTVRLTNIRDVEGSTIKPTVITNDSIYIGRTIGFRSKSTYGD